MKRMKLWLLCWLVLSLLSQNINCKKRGSDENESKDSDEDCSKDSDEKERKGSDEDHSKGSDEKERKGSDEDRIKGSDENERKGSDENRSKGSDEKERKGSDEDRIKGSDEKERKGSDEDRIKGSDENESKDSDEDHSKGSDEKERKGSDEDHSKGSDEKERKGSDEDRSKGSDEKEEKGSDEKEKRGSDKDCRKGSDEKEEKGSDVDCRKGSDEKHSGEDRREDQHQNHCKIQKSKKTEAQNARECMEDVNSILQNGNRSDTIKAVESLEQILEDTEVNDILSLSVNRFVAVLHRPKDPFKGLDIYANENEAVSDKAVNNIKVSVRLPGELDAGSNNTIVFCMFTWPETDTATPSASEVLYEGRLVGLSVRGKTVSGLQERVNITMNLTMGVNETQEPRCVFLNFSTEKFCSTGCQTVWEPGQSHVTCSCDHLTYFGVLMVTANLTDVQQEILTIITLIGCSLSLFALALTVLLFITNRKARADVSMKVHISLVIALILLNLHVFPAEAVAALRSTGPCLYVALSLHYSLLATFTWMALEGFHLYLLLVRVFNIYIRRYLLKLSVVGWGVPAVIISLVVIIDRDAYGRVPANLSNPNNTICYITNETVKMVTTVGVFGLVFIFNSIMLGVAIRRILGFRRSEEFGQKNKDRAKREVFTLLGVTILLGITWGVIFFSFGNLTVASQYVFCILNTLQGFFIFLWFVMSLRKSGNADTKRSSETRSTNN